MVFMAALAGYFTLRWGFNIDKWKSILMVGILNVLGQIRVAHSIKEDWDDILFFSIVQSCLAFGAYSFLEGIKLMDKLTAIANGFISKFMKDRGIDSK